VPPAGAEAARRVPKVRAKDHVRALLDPAFEEASACLLRSIVADAAESPQSAWRKRRRNGGTSCIERLMQTAHVLSDVSEGYVDQSKPAARLRLSGSRSGFLVESTVCLMAQTQKADYSCLASAHDSVRRILPRGHDDKCYVTERRERLPSPFTFAMDRLRRLLGLFDGGLRQETSSQGQPPATTETTVDKNSRDAQVVGQLIPFVLRHLGVSSYIHTQHPSSLCVPVSHRFRGLIRSNRPSRRSQSASPTLHDSASGQATMPTRRSSTGAVSSIRDLLLQATVSPNPIGFICGSPEEAPTMVNSIDEVRGPSMLRQRIMLTTLQWLSRNHEGSLWRSVLQLLRDLCRYSGYLPEALSLSGVDFDSGRDPIACDVFTDVYRGVFNKQEVAVKRVRIAGGPVDQEQFSKVRVPCFVEAALF
jgi:hypothetical protein